MTNLIQFGKSHKNQSIEDVAESDPSYCIWLRKQPWLSNHIEIKNFLDKKFQNDNEFYMRWGKYKNKNLKYISSTDPKYIEYLKENKFVRDSCPDILEAISVLEKTDF